MDIIRNSVWLSQGTDLLAEGLYRVGNDSNLLIVFYVQIMPD
ncbi:tn7-like transposition domain protein, partial [Escherichia coli]